MAASPKSVHEWLLDNREFLRSVSEAGPAGSYRVTLPAGHLNENGIDDTDEVVILPTDIAGQIGIQQDPLFEVYELPLEE